MNTIPQCAVSNPASAHAEILPPEKSGQLQPFGTETLLDSLIEECRRLVREVALPSMARSTDPLDRRCFIDSAVSLIRTAAVVGDTVARLRTGVSQTETRHRVFVEHVPPAPAPVQVAGLAPQSDDDDEEEWG